MKILAIILAGGKRKELMPLVEDRCKAAVPFFGKYRVIDFILSNCLNSGIRQINVVVQYRFGSLQKHIRDGWNVYSTAVGEYIDVYPPQQKHGEKWYNGTADSVYQNLFSIENENPDYVLTLSGDHIYKMDYRALIDYHIKKKADLTIATVPIPASKSKNFGVMEVNADNQVIHFEEKPEEFIYCEEGNCLASMGLYVFTTQVLKDIFHSSNYQKQFQDFGRDIIPKMIIEKRVFAYPFVDQNGKKEYWNFLRTLKEYYDGNMDILNDKSEIELYDPKWPFRTFQNQSSPTRTFSGPSSSNLIVNTAISDGGLIEGKVTNSILGTNITIEPEAEVVDSILFDNVYVKKGAKVTKAIIDKGITIPANCVLNADQHAGWKECTVTDDNIIVLGKNAIF